MQGLSHQEIGKNHPHNHTAWKNRAVDFQPESGESLQQLYDRAVNAVKHWANSYSDREIAVVAALRGCWIVSIDLRLIKLLRRHEILKF